MTLLNKILIGLGIGGVVLVGGLTYGAGITNNVSATKLQEKFDVSAEIKNSYQLEGVTLKRTITKNPSLDAYKGEPKDEIKITIGDNTPVIAQTSLLGGILGATGATTTEFTPSITLSRWNEVQFKLKPKGLENVATKDKNLSFEGDKIKFDTPKISFEMYDYAEGEGGYKYIWYLNEKPATNKVEFQIESSGLDFFYQPELTPEEIAQGASRPENVVGSYAVYHSTKGGMNDIYGKEYKVGKAFHIYRPRIIDAEGKETWAILKIENGIFSEEIPQEFLDTAVYPIKSNETFGYTGEGKSSHTWDSSYEAGSVFTSPSDISGAVVDSLTLYVSTASSGRFVKGLIFLHSDGSLLTNGVGNPVEIPTSVGWVTSNFSTSPNLSNTTDYILGEINSVSISFKYDTGVANQGHYESGHSYETPTSITNPQHLTSKYSIYATYTPAGAAAPAPEVQQILWEE